MMGLCCRNRQAEGVLALALVGVLASSLAFAGPSDSGLIRYKELEPNVTFWHQVFTKWTSRQLVFHDMVHLDLIYATADVTRIVDGHLAESQKQRALRNLTAQETRRLAAIIRRLGSAAPRNAEERRIAAAIARVSRPLASNATLAARIRAQRGLGDQLCQSYSRAKPYLASMRQVLASHGVPSELASLPLVESGYRIGAHSNAGAVGVWQFTRGTGRRFLHIDHVVDERRDPTMATEAAAKYLRENYERLGTWPLAITAYNHGANGMSYAVRKLKTTSLAKIVANYRSRYFGFASRNFYAEFLAAHQAMQEAEARCQGPSTPSFSVDRFRLDAYVPLAELARAAGVDSAALLELNPALTPDVATGRLRVPKGYRLNLPRGGGDGFRVAYARLSPEARYAGQPPYYASHRVRRGQTLSEIARLYRTSVSALKYHNSIRDPRRLRSGQILKVPVAGAAAMVSAAASGHPKAVRLAWGETLSHIASRYRLSVATLEAYNGIADPRKLRAGQLIKIPSANAPVKGFRTHRVGKGQTLSHIARIYRTTVSRLQSYNAISDPRKLRSGQTIKIPL